MTTLAAAQGSLRPADLAFHPGLQIHAIQPPKADRRLSLLISVLCYESLAAVALLAMQHKEAIIQQLRTSQAVILDPVQAQLDPAPPRVALPAPPAQGLAIPGLERATPALPMPDVAPDADPTGVPLNQGTSLVTPGTGTGPVGSPTTGGTATGGTGTGQPLEITVSQVKVLHSVTPTYPKMAQLTRQQGDVVLRMTIDATGAVSEVHVVSGPEIFRPEALRAARGWRFTPARVGGEAVPAVFNLTLQFVMR